MLSSPRIGTNIVNVRISQPLVHKKFTIHIWLIDYSLFTEMITYRITYQKRLHQITYQYVAVPWVPHTNHIGYIMSQSKS